MARAFPRRIRRRTLRRPGHDYRAPGAYLITTVVRGRAPILARVEAGTLALTLAGRIVADALAELPRRIPALIVDASVVMPDHVHAILRLDTGAPLPLGRVVGLFKGLSAKRVSAVLRRRNGTLWQRGYHDRVIRDARDWNRCRTYIAHNPRRWLDATYRGRDQASVPM